jgi:2-deoxy-D-gluconate 3-dehydrogenase
VANPFDLTGKTALVTGANTGIGQALAVALGAAGADIAVAGRSPADDTRLQIEALGRRCMSINADFGSTEPMRRVVDEAVAGLGRIDILVNNAGTIRRSEAIDFTEADWDAVIDTNLKSVFFLSQAAARHMLRRSGGGKIINIASLLSFQGGIRVTSYAASKSGLAGLTRILANEWAGRGLNVNAIAPGYVETNNTAPLRADPVRSRQILERIPAGRWGRPSDIGGAAVFLASAASDYVHGVVLPVDGGWLAR